ncbi:glucose-1-phosphate adenylyltransferase subunit GlgD [Paenibacillus radicis (ex Gao et al. 2016)]|uniref:Glucose-1-phosphate adenylyltransferase subunit GlgD n=1 Tax=Paenibacillus radicis (ex Gao et al. 2016) TaxID=1737354 RepID=A0A917GT07_9BACL|nr:glucose-1-phosphate adenylyltransferase subunit GlgD [Paenibacillus radicis (ex Gao et al. 2016)]GGG56537.1 glucose-1-phosphate adenylyltransferase subunit GlgD [Paenibacillus radicis (ex Gao et al. 2016)]
MKHRVMGVINLIHETDELERLTQSRCLATVPFGARYRLIDFALSSMVNSGIHKVAIFAHKKYRSLMDHVGSGSHWDLNNRQSGLFLLPPATDDIQEISRGDLYHFYQHRDYFNRSTLEYVVITRSHMVCNVDFGPIIEYHQEREADITIVCKEQAEQLLGRARKVKMDEDGRITAIQDHYGRMLSDTISMEMYIMKKELLMELVETSLAQGQDHLVRHAIFSRIDQLRIYGYKYEGYLGVVNTLASYYDHNMSLLRPDVWRELFFQPGTVFTKGKDEPPARYLGTSKVVNSLIANGCRIEGTVENSIIFRGVHIRKGAVVRNSIIMQNGDIGENSIVQYSILDKDVRVQCDRDIRGTMTSPFLAAKRKII